ncbi:hypothetical protein RXV86_05900 [Alisedimentitalea sp. MJ-SS2]|uniref:hypothetical protein n=1 Tax=Aliisedimentitalea sp. MJ-SS2 TaxID=3049795 RepID=UPI00290D0891|nr:hypothetical protein [Alisedimentitalea sp. MJ-SS2]MDU8926910.1 hypothetical protein [Alisedimentitalea sp. MJ-SS2]
MVQALMKDVTRSMTPVMAFSVALLAGAAPAVADLYCTPEEACLSIGTCDLKYGGGPFQVRHVGGNDAEIYRLENGEIRSDEPPDRMKIIAVTDDNTAILTKIAADSDSFGFISIRADQAYVLSFHGKTGSKAFGMSSTGRCTGSW